MMSDFTHWLTHEGPRVLAGVFGAVVLNAFHWEGPVIAARKLLIGGAMAWALGPTGVLLMSAGLGRLGVNTMPPNAEAAVHFLFGAFGMLIFETVVRVLRAYQVTAK
jgi:hypothetical protein